MKKLLMAVAAFGMLLTSCAKDDTVAPIEDKEALVSFCVNSPAVATRYGEGETAQDLYYAVYDTQEGYVAGLSKVDGSVEIKTSTTVNLNLVQGRSYEVIFWAQAEGAPYSIDWGRSAAAEATMTYDPQATLTANNEAYDAFYAHVESFEVKGAVSQTVELKRPFAQLNVATADTALASTAGVDIATTGVAVSGVYTTLNLANDTVDDETTLTFAPTEKAKGTIKANGKEYDHIAMNYVLVNDKKLVDVTLTLAEANTTTPLTRKYTSVPVQRNYRTNIIGNILTSTADFNVEIKPGFTDEDVPFTGADALRLAAIEGGEYTLEEDIVADGPIAVPAGVKFELNLNGKKITANNEKGEGAIIENAGTLSITGGTLENATENGDAVINNTGELVLSDVEIKGAPIGTTGYPNYAIYNYGKLTIEEGSVVSSDRGALNLQDGADVTINGGEFVVTDAVGTRTLTAHVIYASGYSSKLTINGGSFAMNIANGGGTSVICPAGATIKVYGGNFYHAPVADVQSGCFQNYMGYGAPVDVYGGTFNDDTVTKSGNLADGYKAVNADGKYVVVPESVGEFTAVTESTADFATAIATNNGEKTMYEWEDVYYVAEYEKVTIYPATDAAITARGIVESSAIKEATIAEGVTEVGNRTFRKCGDLETVVLPSSLTEIGPAVFQSCGKLSNIVLPASVQTIGEGAFAECVSLSSINIPAGVTRIEKDALRNTGLVSVEFPESVTYFGTYAFRDCDALTEITINAPSFTVESNTFLNASAPYPTMTIYVANAEMKAYLDSKLSAHEKTFITVVPKKLKDGDVVENLQCNGTITVEGNVTFKGDTKIKTITSTTGCTITIEDDKTLELNNFSFGKAENADAVYEIKGGTVTAKYGFFQHGKYALRSNFETGYMYYSYGSDITVYGTFHSQGTGDGLDYVRGKLTIANGGKSIHDKSLWVGQPASWGAMNASLVIEEGGYVQANSLSVYEGSTLTYSNDADLKYNNVTGTEYITKQ